MCAATIVGPPLAAHMNRHHDYITTVASVEVIVVDGRLIALPLWIILLRQAAMNM
jgi:hypothetical protein